MVPFDGAREISQLSIHLEDEFPTKRYAGDGFGIAELYGLWAYYDDVPVEDTETRARFDAEIVEKCRRLLVDFDA